MSKNITQKETAATPSKVYNFCSKKKLILGVVIAVLLTFIVGAIIRGIHLAIEFKGGTLITYSYQGDINTNDVASTVKDIVGSSVTVRTGESLDSGGKQITISFTSDQGLTADRQTELTTALRDKFTENALEIYDSNDVSPSSGREFLLKCLIAVRFAAFIVIVYIAIRFRNWQFGMGGVIALVHDSLLTIGLFSLFYKVMPFSMEIDQSFIAAILTVIGYSINNVVIIFDRVRENLALYPKRDNYDNFNAAINSTLGRTINTGGTTLVVLLAIFIFGGEVIRGFVFAMFAGILIGTYSGIFVSNPLAYDMLRGKKNIKRVKTEVK